MSIMGARLKAFLVWIFYRALSATWRWRVIESEGFAKKRLAGEPVLFANWHGDEIPLIFWIGHYRIVTLVSQSRDGEMMAQLVRFMGGDATRGSSSRGGALGLKQLIRWVKKEQRNAHLSVDGPRGPRHEVKPGVFELSRALQIPIVPAGIACDRMWTFPKSWSQAFLPKPFARIVLIWSEPLDAVENGSDPRNPFLGDQLKSALHQSQIAAQKVLDSQLTECNLKE